MCDVYLSIIKHFITENISKFIFQFIFYAFLCYIAYDFFVKKRGRFYHNDTLDNKGYNPDIVHMYKESKNILGLVTYLQWFTYEVSVIIIKGIGDTFSLIIPLLYTYIFENIYSVLANEKNIHQDIQKDDLDKVKTSNIILIIYSIVFVSWLNPYFNISTSYTYLNYYMTTIFSIIVSYFITIFMLRK
ncbi:hypothetical protein BHU61_13290 (plasmid) [Macrococcus epidermidis]|uniref:Uncharacterized protein n=1 Tax=Macrococcus epidermidis TaxID=1902580 RepID=A0A327ZMN4_9STAP|nr:hypothetical protein BHU61_13290 [Macrococcus epidermidis]